MTETDEGKGGLFMLPFAILVTKQNVNLPVQEMLTDKKKLSPNTSWLQKLAFQITSALVLAPQQQKNLRTANGQNDDHTLDMLRYYSQM